MYGKKQTTKSRKKMKKNHLRYWLGKKLTDEHKKNIALNTPDVWTGKKHSKESIEKMRVSSTGKKHSKETREKMSTDRVGDKNAFYGKSHTEETKKKLRKSKSELMKKLGVMPGYNPKACIEIDNYGKENGYNFQHAENGGEYHIKELGYWVDGYDKEKNIVVEYMEKHHDRPSHIKKDKKRKEEIIQLLNCKFIEIWDKDSIRFAKINNGS
jgi:hypothetical protein